MNEQIVYVVLWHRDDGVWAITNLVKVFAREEDAQTFVSEEDKHNERNVEWYTIEEMEVE